MEANAIVVSEKFKKMTLKAILSIVFFLVVYIFLIVMGLAITALSAFAGVMLIAAKPMFVTIMVGIGLLSMGILIMIFLVKFIFKKHAIDRSDLIEIKKEQEPELFKFINEIVKEVKTDFPKKIYLSADVNACVFYDSSFWSMFLPVRKNLQIGVGLVNSVSVTEFKAILAHEFGHFSQRTMKVGSYVNNVNQVIYNLLYDNDSFQSMASRWGSINAYFSFFIYIAVKIVHGIQWVLKIVYEVVNRNYLALSREMEFHADEVAANVAGSNALVTSLLRLDLANHSYQAVLNYYGSQIENSVKTQNIYPQQHFVMNFLAKESKLSLEENLPQVGVDFLSRYNKSKLNIENQWASHPSTEDRVRELNRLNIIKEDNQLALASILFKNAEELQMTVTEKLFSGVTYKSIVKNIGVDNFVDAYLKEYESNSFSPFFNSYYDNKNPIEFDVESGNMGNVTVSHDELFNNAKVDLIYTSISLESDINVLNQISKGDTGIKTFDYDGLKYNHKNAGKLAAKLKHELSQLNENIKNNDVEIYRFFSSLAVNNNCADEFKLLYKNYFDFDKEYELFSITYSKLINAVDFIHQTTPFEVISSNMKIVHQVENEWKPQIKEVLNSALYQPYITDEIKEVFNKYLSQDWEYFANEVYRDDEVDTLFSTIHNYSALLGQTYFNVKKNLLEYQLKLMKTK